ncbi:MAG TPA: alpha/beta fold hydrolase [Gammaproteobacteria bacterium]|nr:alpha/beta fold hydrolase [Gammaproteobacteria bacterium]
MHYIEEGEGKTILFLHGLSASSYMWRDVISFASVNARCIAVDFIGMGESDKPNIDYTTANQLLYLESFIDTLKHTNITLVMYGWGSIIGLAYAQKHPEKIAGLVLADPYLYIKKNLQEIPMLLQELKIGLKREPETLQKMYIDRNIVVEKIIRHSRDGKISPEALTYYHEIYDTKEGREVLLQTMLDLVYINSKSSNIPFIEKYSNWLQNTRIRKLLIHVQPGFMGDAHTVNWAKNNLTQLTTIDLGTGVSFFPEITPEPFAKALLSWL